MIPAYTPALASRIQTVPFSLRDALPVELEILWAGCYGFVTLLINGSGFQLGRVFESEGLRPHPIVKGLQQPRGWGLFRGQGNQASEVQCIHCSQVCFQHPRPAFPRERLGLKAEYCEPCP